MSDLPDFAPDDGAARPLHLVPAAAVEAFRAGLSPSAAGWLDAQGFAGRLGQLALLPGADGTPAAAAFGWGEAAERARGRFALARAAEALPEGAWRIEDGLAPLAPEEADEAALGWLLAGYRFDRYRSRAAPGGAGAPAARLLPPAGTDPARLRAIAAGEWLTRDLVNTPAADLGPDGIEAAARALAAEHGMAVRVITGGELLTEGFPLIHAVGRAAARAPRLIELAWGGTGPQVTLVGKGVAFDTGGLDLKNAAAMGLMKKDMGGAAAALGLARTIAALRLPLRLRVLIPAVENAVAGNAFRPQDILVARNGLTIEVNSTDAEGRLILADALAFACEGGAPDLLVSLATLTGAARVALGPDLVPFFTDDERLAAALAAGAAAARDPLWRLPFWEPYEELIEPGIADLDNAPSGGMAGAITAALFLRRFVPRGAPYAHLDLYAWQPKAAPARPKGGVGQGWRAVLAALPGFLGL
jgi:leucyl aminopeptidase